LRYVVATIAFVLAMLAKPTAMMTPLLAATLAYFCLNTPVSRIATSLALWIVLAIGCAIAARFSQPAPYTAPVPLWARPLIAGDALAFYAGKILWPANLAVDYGRMPPRVMGGGALHVAWLVPVSVALVAWAARGRFRALAAGAILFVVPLLPVLGIV